MHYKKGRVKASFIKNNDLLDGSLSVWRTPADCSTTVTDICHELEAVAPANNKLYDLFAARAGDIRAIRIPRRPADQVFHAYDDCRTDKAGGKHILHATIAICQDFQPSQMERESLEFIEIRDELIKLLKQNVVWALPSDQRS